MADNKKGVWDLQDTRDQITQSKWTYDAPGDPSRLFSLGQNYHGSLGQGDGVEYSSPVQIQGEWDKIYPIANSWAGRFGIAAKAAGTLYMWGDNYGGQLGQNNNAEYFEPVQIPGTNWSHVDGGDQHIMGTRTDGTLWGWGEAQNTGNLGHRHSAPTGINSRSSPIQIPGTNWSQVSTTYSCVWATKTDGTLWSWGQNQNGELGHNERNPNGYSSPVQVGTNTNWSKVRAGFQMAFLTTTGNAVFAVGNGTNGQLGLNDANDRSSPTIVGGGAWKDIAGGRYTSYGIRDW